MRSAASGDRLGAAVAATEPYEAMRAAWTASRRETRMASTGMGVVSGPNLRASCDGAALEPTARTAERLGLVRAERWRSRARGGGGLAVGGKR